MESRVLLERKGRWVEAESAYSVVFFRGKCSPGFEVYLLSGEAPADGQIAQDLAAAALHVQAVGAKEVEV
jgi:hypothetical protein